MISKYNRKIEWFQNTRENIEYSARKVEQNGRHLGRYFSIVQKFIKFILGIW